MTFRAAKKYLFILLTSSLLFSCIDNSDEPNKPTTTPPKEVGLTIENLLGTWESFFFHKRIIAPANSPLFSSEYRFTEIDGFTVNFDDKGKFTERNVFGAEVISGTYEIIRKNATSLKDDAIKFHYKSKDTGDDTTSVSWIPYIFDNYFPYLDQYNGTKNGYTLKLEDIRYYRHTGRAPNYMLTDPYYKKNMIDIEDLYGTWELTNIAKRENQTWKPMTEDDKSKLGTKYEFTTKNGVPYYYETLPSGKLNQNDIFKIIDDVIVMKGIVPNSPDQKVTAFLFWIKSPLTEITLITYENQRSGKNAFVDEEKRETFKRVK